jgi:hypothetical protein
MHTQISGRINKRLVAEMEAREITDVSWTRTSQRNRLVMMVKDPTTLFAYWEVDTLHKQLICEHFHTDWGQLELVLQVYDVSDILFDGGNAHSMQRIWVHPDSDNWYITELYPGRTYLADVGTITRQGKFFSILRSNAAETPQQADRRKLEPSVRFGVMNRQPNEYAAATVSVSDQGAKVSTSGLRPFHRIESWHEQFDGYHLVRDKGGGA